MTENDHAAEEKDDGRDEQHLFDVQVVGVVTTDEGVFTLHIDQVDGGPTVDGQSDEGDKLGEGQPGRIHGVAVVPLLVQLGAGVHVGQVVNRHVLEHGAEEKEQRRATDAPQYIAPVS